MRTKTNQIRDAVVSILAFEIKIFENTEILKKIEKSMQALKELEITELAKQSGYQNTLVEQYKKACEEALSYSSLEQAVWNGIDCFSYELNEIFPPIIEDLGDFLSKYTNASQIYEVNQRLTELFCQKCIELHEKYKEYEKIPKDESIIIDDDEYNAMANYADFVENNPLYKAINDQIKMKRIIKLQESIDKASDPKDAKEMIEEKFMLIYANKEIHDKLLEVQMNPYSLLEVPDDILIEELKIDEKRFKGQKEVQYIDEINQLIDFMWEQVFEDVSDIKQIIKRNCDLEFVYFLLTQLSTKSLVAFSKETQEIYNGDQEKRYLFIINAIKEILSERKDYKKTPAEILEETTCFPLSENLVEKFVSLIKLSELIINKLNILCDLEKKNLKTSKEFEENKKELESYLEFEADTLKEFDFNIDERETLIQVLDNFLGLLLKDENNSYLVKNRIINMFPKTNSSEEHEEEISSTINHAFILKTLKQFDEAIQKETDPKRKESLIEEKYLQYSFNRCINYDIVSADFDLSKVTVLDDITMADLLKMHDFEYACSKNIELYALGKAILYEIADSEKHYSNLGYITYRKICLEEILKSLNIENILDLESHYDNQIKEASNKQTVERTFGIKKLFKELKPRYL